MLWLVAGMIGWLAVSHVVVEQSGLRFFQPKAEETIRKLQVFADEAPKFDVIFLGSSRMRRAFTPATFEEEAAKRLGREVTAFNLGVKAMLMPSYTIIARDLLVGDRRPDLLVLGLGVRSFNSNSPRYHHTIRHLCGPGDLFGPYRPRLFSGPEWLVLPEVMFRATASLTQLWRRGDADERAFAESVWELDGGNYPLLPGRPGLPLVLDDAAIRRQIPIEAYRQQRKVLREATQYRIEQSKRVLLESFDPEGRCSDAFEELAVLCSQRDIPLIVFNLPVTEGFANGAYVNGEYRAYLEQLRKLCRAHDVPFYDLNLPPYRPEPFFFRDGDHLSREGSWYFTRLVTHEVLVPLLVE